ncbi:hypothetical protein KP509_15G046500 [Ceratopteris richardii]|uniref:Bulb-type lectin domain-containing protein n=1 Tax=Ceratopteris richardii TaxID=49495 RepID=A0A8T2T6L8_CERRI|nr:hypothetical protein KP509_15G046500 [Ceratopteris richardii]
MDRGNSKLLSGLRTVDVLFLLIISIRLLADGNLVLVGDDIHTPIWSSDTGGKGVATMSLARDPISLVLRDSNGQLVWRSADYPTDTLVTNQFLLPGQNLTSWASPTDPSPGLYTLAIEPCGLALYITRSDNPQRYWALDHNGTLSWTGTCRTPLSSFAACLSYESRLVFANETAMHSRCYPDFSGFSFFLFQELSSNFASNLTFLRLEHDGNLRPFSYFLMGAHQATPTGCLLPNFCGPYGLCIGESSCSCLVNASFFSPLNSTDYSQGCRPNNNLLCNSSFAAQQSMMLKLDGGVDYVANNYTPALSLSSQENCIEECENN